jgi:cytosine/adenosine deaminase-related metal-dependent hydrolase
MPFASDRVDPDRTDSSQDESGSVMKQHVPEIVVGHTILPDGNGGVRIRISGGAIAAIDAVTGQSARDHYLAMPALANAHDHGRELRPLCYGAFDQALETWFAALNIHPPVDAYANAAWAFARMAQSGIGLAVHCHMATNNPKLIDDAEAVCRAARDIGIRLALVVPMRDRSRLGYFPDDQVLGRVAAEDREAVRQRWFAPILPATEQLAIADEIARRCEGSLVDVLYGPGAHIGALTRCSASSRRLLSGPGDVSTCIANGVLTSVAARRLIIYGKHYKSSPPLP